MARPIPEFTSRLDDHVRTTTNAQHQIEIRLLTEKKSRNLARAWSPTSSRGIEVNANGCLYPIQRHQPHDFGES